MSLSITFLGFNTLLQNLPGPPSSSVTAPLPSPSCLRALPPPEGEVLWGEGGKQAVLLPPPLGRGRGRGPVYHRRHLVVGAGGPGKGSENKHGNEGISIEKLCTCKTKILFWNCTLIVSEMFLRSIKLLHAVSDIFSLDVEFTLKRDFIVGKPQ